MSTIHLDAVRVRIPKPTPDTVVGTSNITKICITDGKAFYYRMLKLKKHLSKSFHPKVQNKVAQIRIFPFFLAQQTENHLV